MSGGRVFFARYDGVCANCGEDFVAGERIGYDADGALCQEDCLDEDEGEPAPDLSDYRPFG